MDNSVRVSGTRKLSRTASLRAARAAFAGETPAPVDLTLGPLPELDPKIMIAIHSFQPNQFSEADWSACAILTHELLTAHQPTNQKKLSSTGGIIARYLRYAYHQPGRKSDEPLRWLEVLSLELVETYVASLATAQTQTSRATIRSVLRRAVRGRLGDRAPETLHYSPIQPPYTPAECAAFVRLARNQPSASSRRNLSALVALGLGAGLNGHEIGAVRRSDIVEGPTEFEPNCLRVTVKGKRAREVVVMAEYEALLQEVLQIHREQRRGDKPLIGEKTAGHDAANDATRHAQTALGHGVDITPPRLRSTWLVACMTAPVPLSVLMRAAGLKSARSLADLLPYCPTPDPDVAASILRSIGSK
jgi:hypothetical protein